MASDQELALDGAVDAGNVLLAGDAKRSVYRRPVRSGLHVLEGDSNGSIAGAEPTFETYTRPETQ